MKKNYITPEINVVQLEALCNGGDIVTTSVFKGSIEGGDCISKFDVVNEDKTKTEYEGLWGESNSGKWGDD